MERIAHQRNSRWLLKEAFTLVKWLYSRCVHFLDAAFLVLVTFGLAAFAFLGLLVTFFATAFAGFVVFFGLLTGFLGGAVLLAFFGLFFAFGVAGFFGDFFTAGFFATTFLATASFLTLGATFLAGFFFSNRQLLV